MNKAPRHTLIGPDGAFGGRRRPKPGAQLMVRVAEGPALEVGDVATYREKNPSLELRVRVLEPGNLPNSYRVEVLDGSENETYDQLERTRWLARELLASVEQLETQLRRGPRLGAAPAEPMG